MLFKTKTSFVLTVVLMLFAYAITPRLGAVHATPEGETPAAADNPPAGDAAEAKTPEEIEAERKAAEEAAELAVAQKLAAEKAEKKKKVQAEFEKTPLTVSGVVPFVDQEDQGKIENGKPLILGKAGMGDRIRVAIPRLSRAIDNDVIDPAKLVLFIDGRVFKDVYPDSVGFDSLTYKLERTKEALDAWNGLLGSPRLEPIKPVVVSVGYADQEPLEAADGPSDKANMNLIVYRRRWALACLIGLILMVLLFIKYGTKDLLRDSRPPNPLPGKLKPYSLAKVQVAWWFFLVIGCFLLIYLITGEYTMTEQALILIGIGTGTALGSAMIDASKRSSADTDLDTLQPELAKLEMDLKLLKPEVKSLESGIAVKKTAIAANAAATEMDKAALKTDEEAFKAKAIELAEKQEKRRTIQAKIADAKAGLEKPVSEGFWDDLVTDADGVSFHRFQMIVWTVILGVLFLAGVYRDLAMPQFSGTMLALMGISAGTYLGFKIPEKQNSEPPDAAADQAQADAAAAQAQTDAAAQAQADAAVVAEQGGDGESAEKESAQ